MTDRLSDERLAEVFDALERSEPFTARLLHGHIYALKAQTLALRETLEFYAGQYGVGAKLASDGGSRARGALAASPEPPNESGECGKS